MILISHVDYPDVFVSGMECDTELDEVRAGLYAAGYIKPNYPVPSIMPDTNVKSPMLWALVLNGSCYIINNCR